jgi:hypothetical protein
MHHSSSGDIGDFVTNRVVDIFMSHCGCCRCTLIPLLLTTTLKSGYYHVVEYINKEAYDALLHYKVALKCLKNAFQCMLSKSSILCFIYLEIYS